MYSRHNLKPQVQSAASIASGLINLKTTNFICRHNIGQLTISGEAAAVNIELMEDYRANVLPGLLEGFSCDDVYNADETGLFYKCMPNKTLAFKNEKCIGGKQSKDRITVLIICNWSDM